MPPSQAEAMFAAVRAKGYRGWLDARFAAPRGQRGYDWLTAQGHNAVTRDADYFNPTAGAVRVYDHFGA